MTVRIALVHDYLTQRGGAERVVLSMLKAFPGAPLYTSFYLPGSTFPEFRRADVRPMALNHFPLLQRNHRLALPILAFAFSKLRVEADVVVCSSSGWAHGANVNGRKVVYCYSPARWLYQRDRYLGKRSQLAGAVLAAIRPHLVRWDLQSAQSAHKYLTLSRTVQAEIRAIYGFEAELLPAPHALDADGPQKSLPTGGAGFFLCVSRLLPYKNVDAIVQAFSTDPQRTLVVVGTGPDDNRLRSMAPPNVTILGSVSDDVLRWLYAHCSALVCASYEDYGLTPLEAAAFGKPAVVLRWGGFLDTVVDGKTGVFFDQPEPREISRAVDRLAATVFQPAVLKDHASHNSEHRFITRLREVAEEEAQRTGQAHVSMTRITTV